jgi:hypothetical protein
MLGDLYRTAFQPDGKQRRSSDDEYAKLDKKE